MLDCFIDLISTPLCAIDVSLSLLDVGISNYILLYQKRVISG